VLSIHGKRRQALAQQAYCTGLAFLLVLSEVFSSNIQSVLPEFSHLCRLALTGGAAVLLAVKCAFLTRYDAAWQRAVTAGVLAYTAFAAWYGGDIWFFLAALVGLGAKDIDLHGALRVYLATAAAGVVLVQLLHACTPLVPFSYYCRNWDFGYGHYNGYAARLLGIFLAWLWLRWHALRWWELAGLAALIAYTFLVPGSRGAAGAMMAALGFWVLYQLAARIRLKWLTNRMLWTVLALALPVALGAFSLYAGYVYNPAWPYERMALLLLSIFLSGRFEIWHNVFWSAPISLLGGLPTDGDEHHAIDNAFLAVPMNKGILGAVLLMALLLFLLWRLCRHGHAAEALLLTALVLYWFMENKPFLLSANPLLLLLPCALLTPSGEKLPVPQKQS